MAETVLLTCASGKQCANLLPHLTEVPGYKLRLAVNSDRSLSKLTSLYPTADVVKADLVNPEECQSLLSGVTSLYHVGPGFHPAETQIGVNMINAAVTESAKPGNNFKHFVYSSVLHPEFSKMLNHDRKRLIEEYLCETQLNWTILQPSHFGDQTVGTLIRIAKAAGAQRTAVFDMLFNPETVFSFISLKDLGEVSAKVLMERERHYFASYPLCSTEPMPYRRFVEKVGEAIGKAFEIRVMDFNKAVDLVSWATFGTKDADSRRRDGPERMLLFYQKRGLVGNTLPLQSVLGRKATDVVGIVKDVQGKGQAT